MRWTFLLRPSWLATVVFAVVFSIVAFSFLAPWQFRRDEEKHDRTDAIERSFDLPVTPLRDLVPAGAAPAEQIEWRNVEMRGSYLPEAETISRLRSVESGPAFEVLTPMRLVDGTTVLVDRGYVRPDDSLRLPAYTAPPAGEVTVAGRIRLSENDRENRAPVRQDGRLQVYGIDPVVVSGATGVALEPGYVSLTADQPGVLAAVPLPNPSEGRNSKSYALQWIALGLMAPAGVGYYVWREYVARRDGGEAPKVRKRRDRDDADPHDPVESDDPHDPPVVARGPADHRQA